MNDGCITKNGTTVCFVNTLQKPIKTVRHGIFSSNSENKILQELVTYHYPHPDAPEMATVSLLAWEFVVELKKDGVIPSLLKQTSDINKTIGMLIGIVEKT